MRSTTIQLRDGLYRSAFCIDFIVLFKSIDNFRANTCYNKLWGELERA